jgi:hypothetical protein
MHMRFCGWVVILLLAGCGDPRERHMQASLEHARAHLHQAQIEPFAANRLRAALETSGTPIDYLTNSIPPDSELGPYRLDLPEQPFDVVVSGNIDDWRLDGYGASLEKPLLSVRVQREVPTPVQ